MTGFPHSRIDHLKRLIARNGALNILVFDFDGTLRDGLAEKTFAFAYAAKVTFNMLRESGDLSAEELTLINKPYTEDDMKAYAGRPPDEIAKIHWVNSQTFGDLYKKVWDGIYAIYRANRDPNTSNIIVPDAVKTDFLDAEVQHIVRNMPRSQWFPGIEDMAIKASEHAYMAVLSNTPTLEGLVGEVMSGACGASFDHIYSGAVLSKEYGKPNAPALLHIVAKAVARLYNPGLADRLADDPLNGDPEETIQKNLSAMKEAWQIVRNLDLRVNVAIAGDADADMAAGMNARNVLEEERLLWPRHVRIDRVPVLYGWQGPDKLMPFSPRYVIHTPNALAQWTALWVQQSVPVNPDLQKKLKFFAPSATDKPAAASTCTLN